MIASTKNRGWPGDVPVSNLALAGLPVPSFIRTAKMATIEAAHAAKLGRIPPALLRRAGEKLDGVIGS